MDNLMETTKQAGHVRELKRLADNHEVFKDAMGGLLLAPVDFSKPGLRILDSATADGTWLRDLQSSTSTPNTAYIGTDIEAELFPSEIPVGITLFAHDITKPWPVDWHNSFDLVHQRLGLAGSGPHPIQDVVTNLVGLAKPGSWIELVELDIDEPKHAGPALRDFIQLLREVFTLVGMGGNFAPKMRGWLEAAGLEAVEERFVDVRLERGIPGRSWWERALMGYVT
jgi:gliotoxin biosynthesis N-methyltransferase